MTPRTNHLSRYSLVLWTFALLAGLSDSAVRADPLYTITDLGPASPSAAYLSGQSPLDPSGNYLPLLNASQQAAFQAGSFDVYAHPGTGYYSSAINPDFNPLGGPAQYYMDTGNNIGGYAGSGTVEGVGGGTAYELLEYTPGPHVVPEFGGYGAGTETSGLLFQAQYPLLTIINFFGTVAGINDHSVIAFNQYLSPGNGIHTPGGTWTAYSSAVNVSLGTLGGTSGFASALNNSNQVVGWSQTASGAQHAFLYANGSMQDLNLLIPPLSGITLIDAVGIDSGGDIVAYGTNSSGQMNEYYLTPTEVPAPEPGTLAIWGLITAVAAGSAVTRSVRKKRLKSI